MAVVPPTNATVAGVKDHAQLIGVLRLVSVRLKTVDVEPARLLALKPAMGLAVAGRTISKLKS